MTNDPSDLWIYPDNAGEMSDWAVSGKTLSVKWFELRDRIEFPLQHVVALGYDPVTQSVEILHTFPSEDLPVGSPVVSLYTGINKPEPVRRIKSAAREILSPWSEATTCSSEIAVRSGDVAPAEGTISAFELPSGKVIDRRFVASRATVNYSFYARCGKTGVLTFDRGAWRFVDALGTKALTQDLGAWHASSDGARVELDIKLGNLKSAAR